MKSYVDDNLVSMNHKDSDLYEEVADSVAIEVTKSLNSALQGKFYQGMPSWGVSYTAAMTTTKTALRSIMQIQLADIES